MPGGALGQIQLRACTVDISDSEPEKLGSLPDLSRAGQIRLWAILSFLQSYKILTIFSADFRSQLSLFVCLAFVKKKYTYHFFHYMIL